MQHIDYLNLKDINSPLQQDILDAIPVSDFDRHLPALCVCVLDAEELECPILDIASELAVFCLHDRVIRAADELLSHLVNPPFF